MDGEVPNLVEGESGGDDGDAAVLAGDQPAPGAGNASFASAAPVGGAAVAAASVSGASASSSRDAAATSLAANTALTVIAGPFDAATSANSSPVTAKSLAPSASPAEMFVGPPCERCVRGRGGCAGGVSHGVGRRDSQRGAQWSARRRAVGLLDDKRDGDGHDVRCDFCGRQWRGWKNGSAGGHFKS